MTKYATTSRRAILAGAVAWPTLAAPAVFAATPDPVFALIQTHKAGSAALQALPLDVTDEVFNAHDEGLSEQFIALLKARPATLAGIAAQLRYVVDYCESDRSGLMCIYTDWSEERQAAAAFPSSQTPSSAWR